MASARRQVLDKFADIGGKLPPMVVDRVGAALRGSGLSLRAQELAGFSVAFLALGALFGLGLGGPIGMLLLAGLGAAGPILAAKAAVGVRTGQVARQLEQHGEAWATTVAGGRPFLQVLTEAANKVPDPLGEELRVVLAEYESGLALEEAWARFPERTRTQETYLIGGVFSDHLKTGKDPLDPYRMLNLRQPIDIPPVPAHPAPATFEEAVHRLHLAVLDSLEPKALLPRRPAGGLAALFGEKAAALLPQITMAEALRPQRDRIVSALCDEVEGRGPLEALLRAPTIVSVYAVSPADIFAAQLPPEMVDSAIGSVQAPEGYQRAKTRFRSLPHMMRMIDRLVAPLGARFGRTNAQVEGVLPDGWEVAVQLREDGLPALLIGKTQQG